MQAPHFSPPKQKAVQQHKGRRNAVDFISVDISFTFYTPLFLCSASFTLCFLSAFVPRTLRRRGPSSFARGGKGCKAPFSGAMNKDYFSHWSLKRIILAQRCKAPDFAVASLTLPDTTTQLTVKDYLS